MDNKINILNITPKKLKLADYELGQTLGTGKLFQNYIKLMK